MNALRVGHSTPAALSPVINVSAESHPTAVIWPSCALGAVEAIHFLNSAMPWGSGVVSNGANSRLKYALSNAGMLRTDGEYPPGNTMIFGTYPACFSAF